MAGDDHMLRLAALADEAQYVRVSGAREERMIAVCREILEALEWTVTPRLRLRDPLGDVDVYAVRGRDRMAIQLKSTLRPQSGACSDRRDDAISDMAAPRRGALPRREFTRIYRIPETGPVSSCAIGLVVDWIAVRYAS